MKDFFKLKENNTTIYTEIIAGITTFFTMAYIIFINPAILSLNSGMPWFGVFAATILASAFGTIFMALFANVPFALAPGMGTNAFFTFVICKQMGFSWQGALSIVTICGFFIILITVTKLRKVIVKAIPNFLKDSISVGIGLFIAYIGFKNASFLKFLSDSENYSLLANGSIIANSAVVPSLASFNNPHVLLGLIGLIIMSLLVIKKVRGSIFIGIIVTILIGIFMKVIDLSNIKLFDFYSLSALKDVAFAAFSKEGIGNLFFDWNRIILTATAILALLLSVTFDAIGTFIGAGGVNGIFDTEKEKIFVDKKGIDSKFEKALFSYGIAAALSGIFGTSSVTTYIESATGISVGGRTGLTSFVVAILFLLCLPFASIFSIVPSEVTAPALIMVGVLMMSSVMNINWSNLEQAIPAFLTISIMTFAFNIGYGIAAGFIFHCVIKLFSGQDKRSSPNIVRCDCSVFN